MTLKKMVGCALILLCGGVGVRLWAHMDEKCPEPPASSSGLKAVKGLNGLWKGEVTHPGAADEKPQPVSVEFEVTAAGSAVEETLMPGTPHEMVDMYHDEAGKLAVTHYCAMGNQPHMLLKDSSAKALSFEMGSTPGIDAAKDPHMHALTLEFPDTEHLTERWTSYKDGKPGETVVFTMKRSHDKKSD
jgi:hypothetical protein